jgi:hypothetical protein
LLIFINRKYFAVLLSDTGASSGVLNHFLYNKKTGEKVKEYIIKDGLFEKAANKLKKKDIAII